MNASKSIDLQIRTASITDIEICGRISQAAFGVINTQHGFSSEIPTLEFGIQYAASCIRHPNYFNLVAEVAGQVVGACFLDERCPIRGVAMVCVAPDFQGRGIGRRLIKGILERSRDAVGVRLLQHAFNS